MKPDCTVMSIETPNKGGRPPSAQVAEAMRLVAQGMSQYKAYRQTGCSASGLFKALKRQKVSLDPDTSGPVQEPGQQVI